MSSPLGIIVIPDGTDPITLTRKIAGLPLLLRQVRLLKSAGCSEVTVLGSARQQTAMAVVIEGHLSVPETRFFVFDGRDVSKTLDGSYPPDKRIVAIVGTWIVDKSALKRFVARSADGHSAGLANSDGGGGVITGALGAITSLPLPFTGDDLSILLENQSTPGPVEGELIGVVSGDGAIDAIEQKLWAQCRKTEDGLVSRALNRPISIAISKALVHTGISPNQMTVLNLAVGLLAGLSVAFGDYWSVLLGAVLLQLNSILDGVDGELARIRLQTSLVGEWLDTASDDLKNLTFAFGIGYGAWQTRGDDIWLWLTVIAITAFSLYSAIYYAKLIRMNRGDILATSWFAKDDRSPSDSRLTQRLVTIGTLLLRQDFLVVVVLVAAVAGVGYLTIFMFLAASLTVLVAQVGSLIVQRPTKR